MPTRRVRVSAPQRARSAQIYAALRKLYPDAHCELIHRNPFELLVATILSAQCTDKRVNLVTPVLFARYPSPREMAQADPAELESLIKSTGFYRNKARSIRGAAAALVEQHDGQVPQTMEALLQLPGVARKTANVVLGNAFNRNEGVVVDTHVQRVSRRLGLTRQNTPVRIEQDLMALFPRPQWCMLSHLLIFHGRRVCKAAKPRCESCSLLALCPRIGVKR